MPGGPGPLPGAGNPAASNIPRIGRAHAGTARAIRRGAAGPPRLAGGPAAQTDTGMTRRPHPGSQADQDGGYQLTSLMTVHGLTVQVVEHGGVLGAISFGREMRIPARPHIQRDGLPARHAGPPAQGQLRGDDVGEIDTAAPPPRLGVPGLLDLGECEYRLAPASSAAARRSAARSASAPLSRSQLGPLWVYWWSSR